jgi:large subunit ribosomal protein L11
LCTPYNRPGHEIVAKVHVKQIYEIALMKKKDEVFKDLPLEQLCRCLMGSALSMGIQVVSDSQE